MQLCRAAVSSTDPFLTKGQTLHPGNFMYWWNFFKSLLFSFQDKKKKITLTRELCKRMAEHLQCQTTGVSDGVTAWRCEPGSTGVYWAPQCLWPLLLRYLCCVLVPFINEQPSRNGFAFHLLQTFPAWRILCDCQLLTCLGRLFALNGGYLYELNHCSYLFFVFP